MPFFENVLEFLGFFKGSNEIKGGHGHEDIILIYYVYVKT